MNDWLNERTSSLLYGYLHAVYGEALREFVRTAPHTPVWLSLSRNGTRGKALFGLARHPAAA
jgi:hypothetical protein